jgi:hypothetical protein
MRCQTNGLTGMITGSGWVSLLSGWIRRYQVGLGLTGQIWLCYIVRAREPLGHGAGRLATLKIRPKSRIQIRISFSFSNLFYKLQINLNLNQI